MTTNELTKDVTREIKYGNEWIARYTDDVSKSLESAAEYLEKGMYDVVINTIKTALTDAERLMEKKARKDAFELVLNELNKVHSEDTESKVKPRCEQLGGFAIGRYYQTSNYERDHYIAQIGENVHSFSGYKICKVNRKTVDVLEGVFWQDKFYAKSSERRRLEVLPAVGGKEPRIIGYYGTAFSDRCFADDAQGIKDVIAIKATKNNFTQSAMTAEAI